MHSSSPVVPDVSVVVAVRPVVVVSSVVVVVVVGSGSVVVVLDCDSETGPVVSSVVDVGGGPAVVGVTVVVDVSLVVSAVSVVPPVGSTPLSPHAISEGATREIP